MAESFNGLMKVAAQRFDRSAALFSRTVQSPHIHFIHVPPGTTGVNAVQEPGIFDAAEMPLARYVFLKDQNDSFTAVPVFPDRLMIHQYVYTRKDTGIKTMSDLRGKNVLLTGFWVTASFWHRAILNEEYGISTNEINWHVTGPELDHRQTYPSGLNIQVTPGPFQGMELLLEGKVDALMTESSPPMSKEAQESVTRVIPDVFQVQRRWVAQNKFHPIVHLIVVRKEAIEKWPDFGFEICKAYDEAKKQAYLSLQNERYTSLPFMREYLDDALESSGDDPWAYGLNANKAELAKFLELAQTQGMTKRKVAIDELFDLRSLEYQFKARLKAGSTTDGGSIPNASI